MSGTNYRGRAKQDARAEEVSIDEVNNRSTTMHLIKAYISVILIWATTPLAIQWSSESVGFLFGIASRFLLGAIFALSLISVLGKKLSYDKKSIQTYLIGGLGFSSAMLCVYWGAQYIPSGWVSIIFGITPILTGIFATALLGERGLNTFRLIAIVLGIAGLYAMLETGLEYGPETQYGIIGVALSSLFYSLSTVLIKRINADISVYSSVTGTLVVAAFVILFVWMIFSSSLPSAIPIRAGMAIIYLAAVGSVLGFLLFYFVLKHIEVTRTSMITLITPICALLLGHLTNNEPLNWEIVTGCALILSGLLLFEFEGAIRTTKRMPLST